MVTAGFDTVYSTKATHPQPTLSPLDLAIDQAAAAVRHKLVDVLTTTRFGVVTVGQVFVGCLFSLTS